MSDDRCSDGDCGRPAEIKSRKLCRKHYRRAQLHGLIQPLTPEDRLWVKIRKTETCWLWTGTPDSSGYGQISINRVKRLVHRVVYELLIGPIPDGLTLDHLCRVRLCCNPAHLEPVTGIKNVMRGESLNARNGRKTACVHGHSFDLINTYWRPDGTRQCRECRRRRGRELRARSASAS
jgi:hypothetical protein